ncbi:lactate utilization protein C [Polymorphospora sp. NPDC051019]|uniref:LutC/YkgG family protein n=1 Tax=Polymorphospora sp. NPDC051019 TaxID=3155725 RepID=UPI00343DC159
MNARERILARLRQAVPDGADGVTVPRDYRRAGALPPGHPDLLDRFADRLHDYRAGVRRCGADEVADAVAGALHDVRRLVVPAGTPPRWLTGWRATADTAVLTDEPPLTVGDLDAADAVVTGCAVAVADTGTIVLDCGPGQGRRILSLVPDHHVCVVRAEQVVGLVPEALARLDATRPLTFVSGPSATSDIELHRIEGVHGPRRLDVVIVG